MTKAGIYTRGGDKGSTSLGRIGRVPKTDVRIHAVGAIDELNSVIGLMISSTKTEYVDFYLSLQHDLFVIGAIVGGCTNYKLRKDKIDTIERMIDEISDKLVPLSDFILPGGTTEASWLHLARTVCRRAEREIVAVQKRDERTSSELETTVLVFINRLSDLFFVMARKFNENGKQDILWNKYTS